MCGGSQTVFSLHVNASHRPTAGICHLLADAQMRNAQSQIASCGLCQFLSALYGLFLLLSNAHALLIKSVPECL